MGVFYNHILYTTMVSIDATTLIITIDFYMKFMPYVYIMLSTLFRIITGDALTTPLSTHHISSPWCL